MLSEVRMLSQLAFHERGRGLSELSPNTHIIIFLCLSDPMDPTDPVPIRPIDLIDMFFQRLISLEPCQRLTNGHLGVTFNKSFTLA